MKLHAKTCARATYIRPVSLSLVLINLERVESKTLGTCTVCFSINLLKLRIISLPLCFTLQCTNEQIYVSSV